jgi:hypothetical protein
MLVLDGWHEPFRPNVQCATLDVLSRWNEYLDVVNIREVGS